MDEEAQLQKIFGDGWKGKWPINYCDLCGCFSIVCPDCSHGSCSGGSCEKCNEAFDEFNKLDSDLFRSLPEEERQCLERANRLKYIMRGLLKENTAVFDVNKLWRSGKLSLRDKEMFETFLDKVAE